MFIPIEMAQETKLIFGTLLTIIYLIIIELIQVNKNEAYIKKLFYPVIFILVVLFGFIVYVKVMEIL